VRKGVQIDEQGSDVDNRVCQAKHKVETQVTPISVKYSVFKARTGVSNNEMMVMMMSVVRRRGGRKAILYYNS
jgi:saccharopine dehydrogenase-like NADP-dependent oxidoreductase